jgi:hypothetical protein
MVFAALGIQHAMSMPLLSSVAYNIIPHYLISGTIFEKNSLNIKCVLIFSTRLSAAFFILGGTEQDMIKKNIDLHAKYPLFLLDFNET